MLVSPRGDASGVSDGKTRINQYIDDATVLADKAQFIDENAAWDIASGHAGYSLLFTHLARAMKSAEFDNTSIDWAVRCSHKHLLSAAEALRQSSEIGFGLFDGLAGYVFALHSFDELTKHSGGRSVRMANALRDKVFDEICDQNAGIKFIQPSYDVISGLAGVLSACQFVSPSRDQKRLLPIYRALAVGANRPSQSFFFLRDNFPSQELARHYPNGYIDLGVAHGVAGIIPRLINAGATGVDQFPAFHDLNPLISWAITASISTNGVGVWPNSDEPQEEISPSVLDSRWCYGRLSQIANYLTLPPEFLLNADLDNIYSYLDDILTPEKIEDAATATWATRNFGICHGLSGFLLTVEFLLSMDSRIGADARFHIRQVISRWADKLEVTGTYRDIVMQNSLYSGLLNGGVGVLLTKLSLLCYQCERNWRELKILFFGV